MMALAAAAGAALAAVLSLIRLFAGPTLYDRTLAANAALTKAALVAAGTAVAVGRAEWIDVAFAFVFAALVVNGAVLKIFRARTFQAPLAQREDA
jgi:multicomponent Na+:H+ antiporter subunit F